MLLIQKMPGVGVAASRAIEFVLSGDQGSEAEGSVRRPVDLRDGRSLPAGAGAAATNMGGWVAQALLPARTSSFAVIPSEAEGSLFSLSTYRPSRPSNPSERPVISTTLWNFPDTQREP